MSIDPKTLRDGTIVAARYPSNPQCDRILVVRRGELYGPSDFKQRYPHEWGNQHSPTWVSLRVIDEPADPDVDLIERMAGTIGGRFSCSGEPVVSNLYREVARAVLAVVRESEAGAR